MWDTFHYFDIKKIATINNNPIQLLLQGQFIIRDKLKKML